MPIPLKKGRAEKLAKMQRELQGATADIRRHLYKARQYAIEAANGDLYGAENMRVLLDMAIDRGMDESAVRDGPGMVNKINALIDKPESLSHAMGLLLNAADLLTEAGKVDDAASVTAIANTLGNPDDLKTWRDTATPMRPFNPIGQ